ncbi:MAG: SEL1-like repeat protein [Gammaproteobacteria bacterium]|nr:SEL1-like repeat protein [Gammaproteobacteria bacterium]
MSLETAIALSGRSRRTWWRRISAGTVRRFDNDARGRTMLSLRDILPDLCVTMQSEDLNGVVRADAGDAEAQNDLGQRFFLAGKYEAACHWFRLAAAQDHADAMQWLAQCYLGGRGVAADENLALMWLARAAAHGSVIAQGQLQALREGRFNISA